MQTFIIKIKLTLSFKLFLQVEKVTDRKKRSIPCWKGLQCDEEENGNLMKTQDNLIEY